jgi:hypothetical protein
VGIVVSLVMAIGMAVPAAIVSSDFEEGQGALTPALVYSPETSQAALEAVGVSPLVTYESFVLVEASEDQLAALQSYGVDVRPFTDATLIERGSYVVDTSAGEPVIPEELRAPQTDGQALYFVQFIGPVKGEWVDAIRSLGADVYWYMPNYAYLVRMDAEARAGMDALTFVRWTGAYHPAYKISPGLASGQMSVSVMAGGTSLQTIDAIGLLSTVLIPASYESYFDQYTMRISADYSVVDDIARLPDVVWLEQYNEPALMDETSSEITGGIWTANTPYGGFGNYANLQGWDGTNIVVAVADTGLSSGAAGNAGHIDFNTNRVVGGTDYTSSGTWHDGHGHGTHCAGIVAANGSAGTGTHYGSTQYYCGAGVAPDAKLYAQKIFTDAGSGTGIPSSDALWNTFFQNAYTNGAYVHTNSWGENPGDSAYEDYDRNYDIHVRDSASSTSGQQPLIITVAAGNSGAAAGTIGSPGSGKNVITIGASENYHTDATTYGYLGANADCNDPNTIISFSSRGLDDDTRIKPDVVAPGTGIVSTHSSFMATAPNLYGFYNGDATPHKYEWCSGTSQANPHIAGASAVIVDWWQASHSGTFPMPAMVKALLINTAIDIGGTADIPNGNEGWGRAYLPTVVNPTVNVFRYDNPQQLSTGQTYTTQVAYQSASQPLKFTMVYTDAPGATGANPALVNRISLRVTAPGGQIWYGNSFSNGYSVSGTAAGNTNIAGENWDRNGDMYDDTNNIECVYIPTTGLQSGTYTVDVIGTSVTTDVITGGAVDQDFALVMYNAVTPSAGVWYNASVNATGWNLVSLPIRNTAGAGIPWLFADQAGATRVLWDRMMWYNPRVPTNPWRQYNKNWPVALNDLAAYNTTMGVWLNVTQLGDGLICKGGANWTTDASAAIPLKAGWNLVGFPSDDAAYTVANLKSDCTVVDIAQGFMPSATYKVTNSLGNTQVLAAGRAYWVHATADGTWTKVY